MPTSPTPIAALPTPPSRDDPANFATRGDAFLAALPTFRSETNAVATNVYNNAVEVSSNASTVSSNTTLAVNSANAAAGSAGATLWVSGTTYALGAVVWSPSNGQIYRRIVGGAGTTDPSADSTNWTNVMAFVFSSGNAGLGTGSPVSKLHLSNTAAAIRITLTDDVAAGRSGYIESNYNDALVIGTTSGVRGIRFSPDNTPRMFLDTSGSLIVGSGSPLSKFDVRDGFITSGTGNGTSGSKILAGYYSGGAIATWGAEYSSGGPVTGYGVWPSTANAGEFYSSTNVALLRAAYVLNGNIHRWYTGASQTVSIGSAVSMTNAMTLDASGRLLVGSTSSYLSQFKSVVEGITSGSATLALGLYKGGTPQILNGDVLGNIYFYGVDNDITAGDNNLGGRIHVEATSDWTSTTTCNAAMIFSVHGNTSGAPAARARITSGGDFLVGKASVGFAAGVSVESIGVVNSSRDGGPSGYFNRNTDDGSIVVFVQAGTEEGSISVSGNTISYNAFAGSHWSQLQDGSKPDILRGTVMESINELCEWPGESNERLPKAKISDTAGSKKVYGVFMAWDNDWSETNDMYVTAVGAFICRVNGSVAVQEGDLLESNGDGTARVQADDIIRSSTIGKVTSTVKTHEYDDGSYCVPTVLYCG
jgi:hypothetical protein